MTLLSVGFVVFPRFVHRVSQSIGVGFPFVLLFEALFVCMFLSMHQITGELNRVTMRSRHLTQEIATLTARIEAIGGDPKVPELPRESAVRPF